jgi:hypothetical protein
MGRGYLLEERISGTRRYDLRQSLHDGGGAPQLWAGGLSGQLAQRIQIETLQVLYAQLGQIIPAGVQVNQI